MYKPCPFCGDNNAICEPYMNESYVRCQKCGATGPEGDFNDAGILWNERAALTRDQAIERIRDIREKKQDGHFMIHNPNHTGLHHVTDMATRAQGAILELMAIFDIKESEL